MLTRFSVTNYRCFGDEVTLDLCHPRDYAFNAEYIDSGVIRNSLIIGANGSGKTNLLRAIADVRSNYYPSGTGPFAQEYAVGFLNADSPDREAVFKYEFILNGVNVAYSYRKNDGQRLSHEQLCFDGSCVFEYSATDGLVRSDLELVGAGNLNWAFVGDYSSALAYITSNAPVSKGSTLDKLRSFTSRIAMAVHDGWGSSRDVNKYLEAIIQSNMVSELEFFLRELGIDEHLDVKEDPDGRRSVYCVHRRPLPFSQCMSSGTRTLVSLFYLYRVLSPGTLYLLDEFDAYCHFELATLYLLDEFDAYCHFELAETLIRYLGSMAGIQTISTTHNTSLTRNDVMRPDCIFKIGEDGQPKALSELTPRELRFGNNIERLLRNGEFD